MKSILCPAQDNSFKYTHSNISIRLKKKGQPTADLLLYSKLINGGHKNYIGWFNIMVPSHLLQHQSQQLSTRLKDTFTHTIAKRLQKLLTDTAKYLVVFFSTYKHVCLLTHHARCIILSNVILVFPNVSQCICYWFIRLVSIRSSCMKCSLPFGTLFVI